MVTEYFGRALSFIRQEKTADATGEAGGGESSGTTIPDGGMGGVLAPDVPRTRPPVTGFLKKAVPMGYEPPPERPGVMQQVHQARPGQLAHAARLAGSGSPGKGVALLLASNLFNGKTAGITVAAFGDELSKLKAMP